MAEILVIGGGAAGMMAAVFAARAGANVTLLEKNEKLGKKVYITGKGRCNLTNDCDLDEFLSQVSRNPRFLYSALSFFFVPGYDVPDGGKRLPGYRAARKTRLSRFRKSQ